MPPAASLATPLDPTGHVPLAVSVVGVVLLAVLAVVALLALAGFLAGRRHDARRRADTQDRIRAANTALAHAHAADEGWDRAALEAAAREAARAQGFAADGALELVLVAVDDRPGVDDDRAVFVVRDGERSADLVLGRVDGAWRAVDVP
ncbi:hypothetical protein [Patulibacter sp. SYSU D01012]|uniref:hypothetical protein n=1 Tax=Patulibacter sp. SYSU D01012 TaxID=2817381 RepID=UPI001B30CDA7|nr:hypothetical protein [Patulibacter sp. SYSU D01012]